MAVYEFTPSGVCSKRMVFEIEDGVLSDVRVVGGCPGNSQGVMALARGMKVDDVIDRLEGIDCRGRGTSCPDQLACGLKLALARERESQQGIDSKE